MKVFVLEQDHKFRQLVAQTLATADFNVEVWDALEDLADSTSLPVQLSLVVRWGNRTLLSAPKVQALLGLPGTYLILLLEPGCSIEQVKEGLRCGADDFVFQAWNSAELIMRVGIAERILNLKLANRENLPVPMTPPKFQKWKMSTASLRV